MDTWMEEQHAVPTLAGQTAAWLYMDGCGLRVTAAAVTAGEHRRGDAALSRRSAGDYQEAGHGRDSAKSFSRFADPKLTAVLTLRPPRPP
ncbi:hypothetical protein GWL_24700 [Herbaspirillum sp. GW103]|nr:hypothetical protein GWL_24700 [Herbaspirillum sp. GW103]